MTYYHLVLPINEGAHLMWDRFPATGLPRFRLGASELLIGRAGVRGA